MRADRVDPVVDSVEAHAFEKDRGGHPIERRGRWGGQTFTGGEGFRGYHCRKAGQALSLLVRVKGGAER